MDRSGNYGAHEWHVSAGRGSHAFLSRSPKPRNRLAPRAHNLQDPFGSFVDMGRYGAYRLGGRRSLCIVSRACVSFGIRRPFLFGLKTATILILS